METSTSKNRVSRVTSVYEYSSELPASIDETNEPWRKIVLGVVMFAIVVVTVLGNGLVLLAVAREKRLRTTFNMFVVNLAFTDFLVGLIAMSFYAAFNICESWPFGEFLCGLWIFTDFGMTLASIMTLLAISIDRYWSVHWSNHYRTHNTPRKAKMTIAGIWAVTIIVWVPAFVVDRVFNSKAGECIYDPALNKEFVVVVAAVGYHGSTAVMLFCYIKVFLFMRGRSKVGVLHSKVHSKRDASLADTSGKDAKHDEISESDITSRWKQTPAQTSRREKLSKEYLAPEGGPASLIGKAFLGGDAAPSLEGNSVFKTASSGAAVYLRPEDAMLTSARVPAARRPDPDLDSGIESVGGGGGASDVKQREQNPRTSLDVDDGNSAARNSADDIGKRLLQVVGNVPDAGVKDSHPGPSESQKIDRLNLATHYGEPDPGDVQDKLGDKASPHPPGEDSLARARELSEGRPTIEVYCYTDDNGKHQDNQAPRSGLAEGAKIRTPHPARSLASGTKALARERKFFLTLTYIIVAFLICWMPFHVSFDIMAVDPNLVPSSFYSVTYWLAYINSAVNPILYHSSSPEFRNAFRKLFGR